MLVQRHRFEPIRIFEDLARILQSIPPDREYGNFIKSIIVYTLSVSEITEAEIVSAIQQLPTPLKDNVMTTYDLITTRARKEGIEKGIEKGKIEGIIEGKIVTILNAHAKGLDLALIANITAMTEEEVTRILKKHGRLE